MTNDLHQFSTEECHANMIRIRLFLTEPNQTENEFHNELPTPLKVDSRRLQVPLS